MVNWSSLQGGSPPEIEDVTNRLKTSLGDTGVKGVLKRHAQGFHMMDWPIHGQPTYKGNRVKNCCGLYAFARVLRLTMSYSLDIIKSSLSDHHWPQIRPAMDKRLGIEQVDGKGLTSDSIRSEINLKFTHNANGALDWTLSIEEMFFLAALFGIPLAILYKDVLHVNRAPISGRTVTVLLENRHYTLIVNPANAEIILGEGVQIMVCKLVELASELVLNPDYSATTHTGDVTSSHIIPVIGIQKPDRQEHSTSTNESLHTYVPEDHDRFTAPEECSSVEAERNVSPADRNCDRNPVEDHPAPKRKRSFSEAILDGVSGVAYITGFAVDSAPRALGTLFGVALEITAAAAGGFIRGYNHSSKRRRQ
jgi:hypothetical protein